MKYDPELIKRASQAFSVEFRAKLADACQCETRPIKPADADCCGPCCCPLGAYDDRFGSFPLTDGERKSTITYSFSFIDGGDYFANAFDHEIDNGTAEAALGLIYRQRYVGKES